jgi:ABC-type transport system involved in cytochrome c biogenesis ATPase subunit
VLDHQMDIKRQITAALHSLNNWKPKTDVGYKMAIHDVKMQQVGAADPSQLSAEMAEIRS